MSLVYYFFGDSVIMAVSYIVSFHTVIPLFPEENRCEYFALFLPDLWPIGLCEEILQTVLCLLTTHALKSDEQTDGQTEMRSQ